MKRYCKLFLFSVMLGVPALAAAQDLDAHSPRQNDPITKQQRTADKKKEKLKAKQDKADADLRKRTMKLQTKAVRKRMKKSKKKADKWNENKK